MLAHASELSQRHPPFHCPLRPEIITTILCAINMARHKAFKIVTAIYQYSYTRVHAFTRDATRAFPLRVSSLLFLTLHNPATQYQIGAKLNRRLSALSETGSRTRKHAHPKMHGHEAKRGQHEHDRAQQHTQSFTHLARKPTKRR